MRRRKTSQNLWLASLLLAVACGGGKRSKTEPGPEEGPSGVPQSTGGGGGAAPATCATVDFSQLRLTNIAGMIIKPGEVTELQGAGFGRRMYLDFGNDMTAMLDSEDTTTARFIAPLALPRGEIVARLRDNCAGAALTEMTDLPVTFYIDDTSGDFPIYTGNPAKLCADVRFYGRDGILASGTKDCTTASAALADCNADGQLGCKTTTTFRAAEMARVVSGNLKSGVVIAGVTGNYPSATSPLPGAGTAPGGLLPAISDTTLPGTYEYWASTGERRTLTLAAAWPGPIVPTTQDQRFSVANTAYLPFTIAGDALLRAENIAADAQIFGVAGNVARPPAACSGDGQVGCIATAEHPAVEVKAEMAYDLRAGTTYGGVAGRLKYCRNAARLQALAVETSVPNAVFFNMRDVGGDDPATPFLPGLDEYDTIDDRNGWRAGRDVGGAPSEAPWGDDYRCSENDWQLMAADGKSPGQPGTDCTDGHPCIVKDPYTRLLWTKANPRDGSTLSWKEAAVACAQLSYGDLDSGWRLPTQKENLQAYINGISRLGDRFSQFDNPGVNTEYWSATSPAAPYESVTTNITYAWAIRNGVANQAIYLKDSEVVLKSWRCVHDAP